MNSNVNANIFRQLNERNCSPAAVTDTMGSSPLRTVDKTQTLAKRKLSEGSLPGIKKLRVTPQQGVFERKFGTPQRNKIDKYFIRKETEPLDVRETARPHVTADCVIEISSDDSGSDTVVISGETDDDREGITSPDMFVLESYDLHGIEPMEVATCAVIPTDGSHAERAHHVAAQDVRGAQASAKGNVRFTCRRKELADSPDLRAVYVKKLVPVGSSCSDVSSGTTVCTADSEPVFVSDSSEPEAVNLCDDKPLVVAVSDGGPVGANCDSFLTASSGEKSLMSCSSPSRELVGYNSPRSECACVCSYRKPASAGQFSVWDPVDVEEPEVTHDLGKESAVTDAWCKGPVAVDMADEGPVTVADPVAVNRSARKNVIVDRPEKTHVIISALDEQRVIGDEDRQLGSLAEEGLSGEMVTSISHAVTYRADTVSLNEEATSQNTVNNNAQNHSGTSGSCDEYPYTSTSTRDGKVGEPVTCDQVIASYQAVMYNHYDRPAARLELRWVPFCCQDPFSCTQHHKNALWRPSEVCDARSQMVDALMNARQWSYAFNFCCSFTSERIFPSVSTVLRILDFILNTHEIDLIGSAVSTFKKIIDLHPPCAPNMLQYYTSVLTGALREDTPHLSTNGILDDVISKLNDMILLNDFQSEDVPYRSQTVCEDPSVTVNGTTGGLLDISADERAEADKNYSTLSRDEKLNRLFVVLEILVELLEIDLCVFLAKHSFQLRKALIHRSYRPLIVSVLWRTNVPKGIGHLNGMCRCIIALYAKCFGHNVNFNKWNVIARLVTLVAETVRVSEYNDESLYPYFGEKCKTLAREVSQCLSGMNPEDLVQVLSEMRPSFLTLYATNFLLSNAVGYETTPSLDTAVELISRCFLLQDVEAQELSRQIHATSHSGATGSKRNINKRDSKGETILHRVCRRNKVQHLKELLKDPNIDVNIADNFGWTALHEAVRHGAVECVFELLENGPPPGHPRTDIHAQSEDGTTPLIDAVQSNQLESCKLLLKYGGSSLLRAKNQDGKSALDVAASPEIESLLESFRREGKFIGMEARWHHCSLVSELLPVMVHSYMDTYLTLHIENELKSRTRHSDINIVRTERRGRPKLKFDYSRFLKDYKSLTKLKAVVRDESKKVPASEMVGKFLFLLQ